MSDGTVLESAEEAVEKQSDIKTPAAVNYETQLEAIDQKYSGNTACTMADIEQIAKDMLKTIPKLHRDRLRDEMEAMHVSVSQDPTTYNINEGLAKVQGYKDRLASILALAQREFNRRDKVFDMLVDANNVVSKASSADKRKGEAIMKYPTAFLNLESAETFVEEVELYMNNMKSIGEIISRQASVLSAQISLGEYRKRQPGQEGNPNSEAEEMDYKSGVKKMDWDTM